LGPFVVDTIDSITHYSVSDPTIVVTVDRNQELADYVQRERPGTLAYVCTKRCGWGPGMYRLFCEAVRWLVESGRPFDYLINMDYDLIFTRQEADVHFLPRFTHPNIGLVGKVNNGSAHWKRKTRQHMNKLLGALRMAKKPFPMGYSSGDHTSGAGNILKRDCVLQMYHDGFLKPPLSDISDRVPLSDDPLLGFFVAASGYKMADMGGPDEAFIVWQLQEDYHNIPKRGSYWFHPTKAVPGNEPWSVKRELECRNYFRGLRGQESLTMDGLPEKACPLDAMM
jgi:hypothetical protein